MTEIHVLIYVDEDHYAFVDKWDGDPSDGWAIHQCEVQEQIYKDRQRQDEIEEWYINQSNGDCLDDDFVSITGMTRVDIEL